MFRVTIDDYDHVEVSEEEVRQADLIKVSPGKYHAIIGTKNYMLELSDLDLREKTMLLNINGRVFHIRIDDQLDLLIEKLGLARHSVKKSPPLVAPMPGLVVKVLAQPAMFIQTGDPLIVFEAMKMENVLKATQPGVIQEVKISPGQAVKQGEVLMTFE